MRLENNVNARTTLGGDISPPKTEPTPTTIEPSIIVPMENTVLIACAKSSAVMQNFHNIPVTIDLRKLLLFGKSCFMAHQR